MPENRFFCEEPLQSGETVCLVDAEHHHLARVMRIAPGETIELVNGKGALAEAEVMEILKNKTSIRVLKISQTNPPSWSLSLAVPLMRPAKLEWVIEKGTEIGADRFLLFSAEQGEKEDLNERQKERLFNIRIAALKQSGRLFLPSIELFPSLATLLNEAGDVYFGDPEAPPIDWGKESVTLLFATGPEKGFSPEEYSYLEKRGKKVRLSPYTLRAETAPLVAAAQALCQLQKL